MIGERLAQYEITALLGKGGMGEVYRARDPKLDREVAIKILPPETARDPERIARFSREARTLASLNHANIAGLFGLEEDGERRFLVMELVEGEDLRERLDRGPLDLDEALDVARQLAEGLEEAHEKGIVHRDLKPANVKLTPDGRVKILDFGLARAMLGEGVDEGDLANSPTITAAMTAAGTVLGTAAYMSPEQARGRPVDRRADLWAFGVILWEMLTGERLFEGETVSDTLAAVLRAEPDWAALPGDLPLGVRRLLERCLERDPRKRLRDIGEARVRLERWRDDPSTLEESGALPAAEDSARRAWWPWAVCAVLAVIAVAGWMRTGPEPAESSRPLHLALDLAGVDAVRSNVGPHSLISPDGGTLAYIADNAIRIRPVDQMDYHAVPASDNATSLAFSPDGKWLAYQRGGRILRVSVTGGTPLDVCEVFDPRGLCWVDDQTIVFTRSYLSSLSMISLTDGSIEALTTLDSTREERSHRWPSPVPGTRSVLYMAQSQGQSYADADLCIVDVDTRESKVVYHGGAYPQYAGSGHLVFARDQTLVALGFDPQAGRTSGVAVPVLDGVSTLVRGQEADDGSAQASWSTGGTLLYRTTENRNDAAQPAWLDLETGQVQRFGTPGTYRDPRLSPDGSMLAIAREIDGVSSLFLIDLQTGVERRFTSSDSGVGADEIPGGWGSEGKVLYWVRSVSDRYQVLRRRVDGQGPAEVLREEATGLIINAISPDGRWGLAMLWPESGSWDVALLDLVDPEHPLKVVSGGVGTQIGYDFSPDSRWFVMYTGTSGMRREVRVVSVDDPALAWSITSSEGEPPELHWSADGKWIYLRRGVASSIRRIPIQMEGASPVLGREQTVRPDDFVYVREFLTSDLTPDHKRMIVLALPEFGEDRRSRLVLMTDWYEELLRRAPLAPGN